MVRYCNRCGKDNLDDAQYCSNCGAPLQSVSDRHARRGMKRADGLSVSGSIAGIVFGLFLIFVGFTFYQGWVWNWALVFAVFILLLGILIIVAALFMRRRVPLGASPPGIT